MTPKEAIKMTCAIIQNGERVREKAELLVLRLRDKYHSAEDDLIIWRDLDSLAREIGRIPSFVAP